MNMPGTWACMPKKLGVAFTRLFTVHAHARALPDFWYPIWPHAVRARRKWACPNNLYRDLVRCETIGGSGDETSYNFCRESSMNHDHEDAYPAGLQSLICLAPNMSSESAISRTVQGDLSLHGHHSRPDELCAGSRSTSDLSTLCRSDDVLWWGLRQQWRDSWGTAGAQSDQQWPVNTTRIHTPLYTHWYAGRPN